MARTVPESLWDPAAPYRLHMEVTQAPGRAGQLAAGKALCCGLGDRVGEGLSLAGLRGVAQTPQGRCREEGRDVQQAHPAGVQCGGVSLGGGGLTLGHPGLSPSLPQPQVCKLCVAAGLGVGGLSLMAQSWAWVGTTPP